VPLVEFDRLAAVASEHGSTVPEEARPSPPDPEPPAQAERADSISPAGPSVAAAEGRDRWRPGRGAAESIVTLAGPSPALVTCCAWRPDRCRRAGRAHPPR
jgi:hypothetical protein